MNIKVLNMIFFIGTLSVSANAVDWSELGDLKDKESQLFLDADSIKPYRISSDSRNNYMSTFAKLTYSNNHKLGKNGYYYTKSLVVVDCNKKAIGTAESAIYGSKDEVLHSYQNKYLNEYDLKVVFPETIGEIIVEGIC